MRVSRTTAVLHEPFICPSCVFSAANARLALRDSRRVFQANTLPTQRKLSQWTRSRREVQSSIIQPKIHFRPLTSQSQHNTTKGPYNRTPPKVRKPTTPRTDSSNLLQVTQSVVDQGQRIIEADLVPEETHILEILEKCHALSEYIIFGRVESPPPPGLEVASLDDTSATASLLGLQEEAGNGMSKGVVATHASSTPIEVRQKAARQITNFMCSLLQTPQIFISPSILEVYVRTVCLLGQPESLPEIFSLYANKPVPNAKTANPVRFSSSNPRSASNAIPKNLADAALSSAIATKNLPLALSIVDTTVKAPAWFRRKLLREASGPILASSTLPFIAYTAATQLGEYQITTSPTLATGLAFTGIMTYFIVTGTFGYVALTTFNDHHQRVRWRHIGLTERWVREDERAMFDRIALGWGFKEKWRWGEEEGEEWEALREFCGRRGMILDRTELLEGME